MKINPATRLGDVKTYYFAKKLAEIAAMNEKQDVPVINLGIGSPDLLPPSEVIEALKAAAEDPLANKYQSYKGLPELRAGFADWYQKHFSVAVDSASEILPLIGSKEGIMHIHMSLINPGDEVLVPNPGYPAYRMTTALAGGKVRFYDLNEEGDWLPDLETLGSTDLSNVKIMWINYPHMPTGAKASIVFYEKLVAFARKHSILICHDNPYAFILNEEPLSIFQVEGSKDCCIELVSLSKCYNMSGWRVGALVAQQELVDTILKFKSNMDSGMYRPIQVAAAKALSLDKSWMDGLNEIYADRREVVYEIMDELGASYDRGAAGMFVWGKLPKDSPTSAEFIDNILYNANVFITPGHIFGSSGEGYIRISLCCEKKMIQQALENIKSLQK